MENIRSLSPNYSVMGFGNVVITSCAGIGSKQGSIMLLIREPFDSGMEKSGKNMQEKISRIYIGKTKRGCT